MPTFDLSVWDAYAVISAPAFVNALKSVVLPALGSPTMPTSRATAAKGTRQPRGRSRAGLADLPYSPKPTLESRANRFMYATRPSTMAVRPSSVSS